MQNEMGEVAGASLVEAATQVTSRVQGLEQDSIVEVFNPLSIPFRVKYGRTVVAPVNETAESREKRLRMQRVGVDTQKLGDTVDHVISYVLLQPGKTMRLPGNVAQVAVRQLVTDILQRRGQKKKLADAVARREVEDEIIHSINGSMDFLNQADQQDEIERLNQQNDKEVKSNESEAPFPSLKQNTDGRDKEDQARAGTQGASRKRGPTA